MKRLTAGIAALALIAGTSVASAATAQRTGAAIGDSEGAGPSTILLAVAFAAVAAGIVIVTEDGENEIPTSP